MKNKANEYLDEKIQKGFTQPLNEKQRNALIDVMCEFTEQELNKPSELNPVTIFQLVKYRWEFKEIYLKSNENIKYLRWVSPRIQTEDGEQYWIELELGKPASHKKHPYVSYCWLNWNIKGMSDKFVVLPNLSKLQSIEGLQAFLLSLLPAGSLQIPYTDNSAFIKVMENKKLLGEHCETIKYM